MPAGVLLLAPLLGGCATGRSRTRAPAEGSRIYAVYCADCHGLSGANDRHGAVPQMRLRDIPLSEQEVRAIVQEGRGGMPALKSRLTEAQVRVVAHYVASWVTTPKSPTKGKKPE